MAMLNDPVLSGSREETIKSQFLTREGTYKLMTLSEYSRPNRVPFAAQGGVNQSGNAPVRVSFVSVPEDPDGCLDRICFNVGRELYVYPYRGVRKAADLNKPIDKRVYKGTFPTCHDFDQSSATVDSCTLIIGFSAGQIQLIDPFVKDVSVSKLYNEDRLIDKTRVTCLKWLPNSSKHFLAAHASGQVYLYNEELPCGPAPPTYQLFKQGDGFSVHTCKTKSTRNPMYRWVIGEGAINEFEFSPDHKHLAVVSQDGFLRIFNYDTMELVGLMRSYFGGLLCVSWSPDGKYLVVGGEDDLVTVYSFWEKRIVCRGHGHRSWVSQVAFDPFTTCLGDVDLDLIGSEEDVRPQSFIHSNSLSNGNGTDAAKLRCSFKRTKKSSASSQSLTAVGLNSYRFGSVSHDTQLCLWDLTEDMLKQLPPARIRTSTMFTTGSNLTTTAGVTLPYSILPTMPMVSSSTIDSSLSNHTGRLQTGAEEILTELNDKENLRGKVDGSLNGGANINGCAVPLEDRLNNSGESTSAANNSTAKQQPSGQARKTFSIGSRSTGAASRTRTATGVSFGRFGHGSSANATLSGSKTASPSEDQRNSRVLGTSICPRMDEVPLIEPLITKKIAHERLTVLVFREDCVVTACQEGFICTWARPGKSGLSQQQSINSPNPGGSPNLLPGGTVV